MLQLRRREGDRHGDDVRRPCPRRRPDPTASRRAPSARTPAASRPARRPPRSRRCRASPGSCRSRSTPRPGELYGGRHDSRPPWRPRSSARARFGITPRSASGRSRSHVAPSRPRTTTFPERSPPSGALYRRLESGGAADHRSGPANCGKVALLLDRFLEAVDGGAEPFLVVPNRSDAELVERELLRRRGAVLGGAVGTFDDLFEPRAGALRRGAAGALAGAAAAGAGRGDRARPSWMRWAPPRASPGFADGLARMFDELAGQRQPDRRRAPAGGARRRRASTRSRALRTAYLERLAALGALDRAGMRARGPSWSRRGWTPGTARPCWPTASRT